ncbi:hypothetical protein XELAEV_18026976mg [Xenopus laevis]|uniref:Uncharacterized protein n=1 Tax=Xenopus laevis TaxID=8355 RepID=A0A974HJ86_XENLA|nr:hypothetical protein XELAEV_18026976mg [Xenopus laevis]
MGSVFFTFQGMYIFLSSWDRKLHCHHKLLLNCIIIYYKCSIQCMQYTVNTCASQNCIIMGHSPRPQILNTSCLLLAKWKPCTYQLP